MTGKLKRARKPRGHIKPRYSDEAAREIISRLANGETLQAICADDHLPTREAVYSWLRDERMVEFAQAFARARLDQTNSFVDEALGVARGKLTNKTAYPAKVRIDTLLSVAARMNPAQFSERFNAALVQGDHVTVHNVISLTPPASTPSARLADAQPANESPSQSLSLESSANER